jgi:hypothetical protein
MYHKPHQIITIVKTVQTIYVADNITSWVIDVAVIFGFCASSIQITFS